MTYILPYFLLSRSHCSFHAQTKLASTASLCLIHSTSIIMLPPLLLLSLRCVFVLRLYFIHHQILKIPNPISHTIPFSTSFLTTKTSKKFKKNISPSPSPSPTASPISSAFSTAMPSFASSCIQVVPLPLVEARQLPRWRRQAPPRTRILMQSQGLPLPPTPPPTLPNLPSHRRQVLAWLHRSHGGPFRIRALPHGRNGVELCREGAKTYPLNQYINWSYWYSSLISKLQIGKNKF